MSADAPGARAWTRLRTDLNPLRMAVSSGVWASAWYLFSTMIVSTVLFAVIVAMTATSASLVIVWAGLPMLIGTAYFIRGCAAFERLRARAVVPEGLPRLEPVESAEGFFKILKAHWRDGVTVRGLLHFTLLYPVRFVVNTVVLSLWLSFLSLITLPIWYRYVPNTFDNGTKAHGWALGYLPNGPHGPDRWGFFVGSDQSAAVAAVVGLALFLVCNYLLVATARLNVNAVRAVIAGPRDPLAAARQVLDSPGPLRTASGH